MRRICGVLVVVLVAGVGVGGCGSDEADSDGDGAETTVVSDGGVPFGLESVELPESESEVAARFEAVPAELEGLPRVDAAANELAAKYGGELNVLSAGLASGFDAGTVLGDLSSFEDEPGAEIEDSDLDRGSAVVFVVGSFQDEGGAGKVYVATWGDPEGEWLFSAGAETPEMREALVLAFVDTA